MKVRRAIVRRRVEPPKTRHGRRSVPLSPALVAELRAHLVTLGDDPPGALVFPSARQTPLDPDNLRARMLNRWSRRSARRGAAGTR